MSSFKESPGKLDHQLLNRLLLDHTGKQRPDVRTGPAYGVDTAVVDLGNGKGLAISSDPLSLIPPLGFEESAWLTVHLLANDMATTGFAPAWAQFVLNLPMTLNGKDFKQYWMNVSRFCEEIDVAITGGHTGKVQGQESTLPGGGTMFLTAPIDQIITADGARPGDLIVVSKEAALLSSSILARSFPKTVSSLLGEQRYRVACDNFYRTSSLKDALAASSVLTPHTELRAMHDVTEGGIVGAILEMAAASGCGTMIEKRRIPLGEIQREIGDLFDMDPYYSVGAGSMVFAVAPGYEAPLLEKLESESIPAAIVGEMVSPDQGNRCRTPDGVEPIEFDGQDPYWPAFYRALEKGWT